jgi:amino acid transporter
MSQKNGNKIGLIAAIIIGMNAMVGIGIVTFPATLSIKVGPASIITFLISVGIAITLGLSLGRVAVKYPGEGWTYLYPSKWAGHKVGIFSSFSYVTGVLIAMGFLIQQVGIWGNKLLPFIPVKPLGLIIILILMVLVIAGAHASKIGQFVISGFVIIPLVLTAIVCLFNIKPELLTPFAPHGITPIISATSIVLFALLGFECTVSLYAVVKNPEKNVPRAFILSILAVGLLYTLFTAGIVSAIHPSEFSAGFSSTLAHVLERVFPSIPILAFAVLIGALFGIIGTLHSMLWTTSTLLTDVLKKTKAKSIKTMLAKKIWTNKVSIFVCTGIMIASSLIGAPMALIELTVFFMVLSNLLSIFNLFLMKEEWTSGRNVVTVIAFIGGCALLYFSAKPFLTQLLS